jgi:mannose-6-phosphate isomerase-like protein (cupin superfamily)
MSDGTFVAALTAAMAKLPTPDGKQSVRIAGHGTLEVKLYAPRGHDPQTPHARDEIYVVAAGAGEFVTAKSRTPFVTGDLLFATAGVPHRFEGFGDDFFVWVLFYGPEGGET